MWLSESEKEQVCLLCVQLKPDLGITDVESYLDALDDYCHAQTKKEIFEKLNKDEVADFCYRKKEGYPDHYDALDTNHKKSSDSACWLCCNFVPSTMERKS